MVLDKLEKDRVNIKDLSIGAPRVKSGTLFDPQNLITEEQWSFLRDNQLKMIEFNAPQAYLHGLFYDKFLFPKRVEELNTEQGWKIIRDYLIAIWGPSGAVRGLLAYHQVPEFMRETAETLLVFPDRRKEIEEIYKPSEGDILKHVKDTNLVRLPFDPLLSGIILFPERLIPEIRANNELKEYWQGYWTRQNSSQRDVYLDRLIIQGGQFRLIFPDLELKVDTKDWDQLNNMLKDHKRDNQWTNFYELAYHMMILSAQKAQVTEDGNVEIVMPQPEVTPFIEQTPLPEQRKF